MVPKKQTKKNPFLYAYFDFGVKYDLCMRFTPLITKSKGNTDVLLDCSCCLTLKHEPCDGHSGETPAV